MSARVEFGDLMRQTAALYPFEGQNEYGEAQYGNPVSIPCRIEYRPRRVLGAAMTETVATMTLYLDKEPRVGMRDKLVLPDGTVPIIVQIERHPDENGIEYYQGILTQ